MLPFMVVPSTRAPSVLQGVDVQRFFVFCTTSFLANILRNMQRTLVFWCIYRGLLQLSTTANHRALLM